MQSGPGQQAIQGARRQAISRDVNYLRLSITDRCNLRCLYCASWEEWQKLPAWEILRYEEFLVLAGAAARAGVRKVRVTGGEPLVRRGVVEFLQALGQVPGLTEVCLTTNGVLLPELAGDLFAAGVRHLNLSLDSLKRERYRELTGADLLPQVLKGLEAAVSLGFHPLKLNCVVLKGVNDDELLDFAALARDYPLEVRFIEFMPTVSRELWGRHFFPMEEVRRILAPLGLEETDNPDATAGPAHTCRAPGFQGRLGFIDTVSEHRCLTCNRLRLTAAGRLRPCLFAGPELDVKQALRRGEPEAALARLFREAMRLKDEVPRGGRPAAPEGRAMVSIGG
jgi:cyclic pyranopterin phosphate synthase